MVSVKLSTQEGESPLDALIKLLGCSSREDFARRIGVSERTVRRWVKGTPATFTLAQMKALKRELDSIGFMIEDLPDSFAPTKESA
jgi:transcriptional regulator with XRE-family HTH domain